MAKCRQIVTFAKFAIFVEFAAFRIPPLLLAVPNLRLNGEMSSNSHFRQLFAIFVEFAAFRPTPLFRSLPKSKSLWRNVVNRQFSQICHFRRIRCFSGTPSFVRCLKSKN